MDRKEADILSQVLEALLDGQDFDQERLDALENRLQEIAGAPAEPVQQGAKQEGDPFAQGDDPSSAPSQEESTSEDPFSQSTSAPPAGSSFEQEAAAKAPSAQEALETEIALLKEELEATKEIAKEFEQLYKQKDEQTQAQSQMMEMTINHVTDDLQSAQQEIADIDEMRKALGALETHYKGAAAQLQDWFPSTFFWSGKDYQDLSIRYYCMENYDTKYLIAVSVPAKEKQRPVVSLAMQLMLYARVTAERYTNASLVYEAYVQCMEEIAALLSIELPEKLWGAVMVFDAAAEEVAIAGDHAAVYQQEGNLIKFLELGESPKGKHGGHQYRIRRCPFKSGMKFMIPMVEEVPESFNLYLREAGNLDSGLQQEQLQQRYEKEQLPRDFALLRIECT